MKYRIDLTPRQLVLLNRVVNAEIKRLASLDTGDTNTLTEIMNAADQKVVGDIHYKLRLAYRSPVAMGDKS